MESPKITAVILAKNEAGRLNAIFDNLNGFAEIVVFDGGSTDLTESVCADNGVRFIPRPPHLRDVIGGDYRFAFSLVSTPYILVVNCSHYYPRALLEAFSSVAAEEKYRAVYHDVVIYSYGAVVHRPFFRRRSSATNLYRKDAINWANSKVHNEAPIEVPESEILRLPARDELSIHLFRDYNVQKSESNHSFYGDQDSNHRYLSGVRTNLWLILWRPFRVFLYQYIRCGSILYGAPGLIYSILFSQLELNIQLKLWELQNEFDLNRVKTSHLSKRTQMMKEGY